MRYANAPYVPPRNGTDTKKISQEFLYSLSLKTLYLVKDSSFIEKTIDQDTKDPDQILDLFYEEVFKELSINTTKENISLEFKLEKKRLDDDWQDEDMILKSCLGKDLMKGIQNCLTYT